MKAVLPLAIALLPWAAIQAASITATSSADAEVYDPDTGQVIQSFTCSGQPSCDAGGYASGTATVLAGGVEAVASAFGGPVVGSSAAATAAFTDTLTILGGTGSGRLQYTLLLTAVPSEFQGGAGASVLLGSVQGSCTDAGCSPSGDLIGELEFTFGSPIAFEASAQASAGSSPKGFPGTAFALGAVYINPFVIKDSLGRALPQYVIASESGRDYATMQTTPEPSTALLLLAGLGLCWSRWRTRPARPAL